MAAQSDPYRTLGVSSAAPDAEVRAAYRRLAQRHHPDHNGGSAESARRFEEVQEAYAQVRALRARGVGGAGSDGGARAGAGSSPPPNPDVETRLAQMERELKAVRDARDHAVRQARAAAEQVRRQAEGRKRATDEELGYFSTDDSFTKIVNDAAAELSDRWTEARRSPAGHRISDLIDELTAKLTGEPRSDTPRR